MAGLARSSAPFLVCIVGVQLAVGALTQPADRADNDIQFLESSVRGNTLGIPSRERLEQLAKEPINETVAETSGLVKYVAYPIAVLLGQKVRTIGGLLYLPYRVAMAPVDAARAIWRTKDAMQSSVNATQLRQVQDELNRIDLQAKLTLSEEPVEEESGS